MKYFVHNEQQKLEFKGFASSSINPLNYYQIALETLSMGSGIPEPVLKGSQAGAITGSEVNERAYFKLISDEQTDFEQVIRELVDSILLYLGEGSEEEPLAYKNVWKPSYEPTAKEKAELDYLNAQTAVLELQSGKTIDEVRKDRYKLKELPAKAGVESPLTKKPEPAALPAPYGSTETQSQPGVKPTAREGQSPQQSPVPEKGDGNPAAQVDAFEPPAATATEKAAAEKKVNPSLQRKRA
jgi:hypothetical protein